MTKTVLKEYPKVTVEEDFNPDRIMTWLIRHYNDEKQGCSRATIAFNKLDAILVARGADIITIELLKSLIEQAINLANLQYETTMFFFDDVIPPEVPPGGKWDLINCDIKYTNEEISQGHADTKEQIYGG